MTSNDKTEPIIKEKSNIYAVWLVPLIAVIFGAYLAIRAFMEMGVMISLNVPEHARKALVRVPIQDGTLPHEIIGCFGAARVLLRPASAGTGVIAGGPVRAVLEAAGVRDVLTKNIGTSNPGNVVRATMSALQELDDPVERLRELGRV